MNSSRPRTRNDPSITHPFEFNFRDDNQFWDFEDFMNVQPTPVASARSRGQLTLYGRG